MPTLGLLKPWPLVIVSQVFAYIEVPNVPEVKRAARRIAVSIAKLPELLDKS
jgi:hypothetical protein